MSKTTFKRGARMFPIRYQAEIDLAAFEFLSVGRKHRWHPRAQAWLAYTAMTALLDGWRYHAAEFWGELARLLPGELAEKAEKLARDAVRAEEAFGEDDKNEHLFDAYWALAYVLLQRKAFGEAIAAFRKAVALHDKLPPRKQDHGLKAEAADALVFLGRLDEAQAMIDAAAAGLPEEDQPEWFFWVRGWVHFGQAAWAARNGRRREEAEQLAESRRCLEVVVPDAGKLDEPGDFDACILLAAVLSKQGHEREAHRAWAEVRREIFRQRQVEWTVTRELRRSPFDDEGGEPQNLRAAAIKAYLTEGLLAVGATEDTLARR